MYTCTWEGKSTWNLYLGIARLFKCIFVNDLWAFWCWCYCWVVRLRAHWGRCLSFAACRCNRVKSGAGASPPCRVHVDTPHPTSLAFLAGDRRGPHRAKALPIELSRPVFAVLFCVSTKRSRKMQKRFPFCTLPPSTQNGMRLFFSFFLLEPDILETTLIAIILMN